MGGARPLSLAPSLSQFFAVSLQRAAEDQKKERGEEPAQDGREHPRREDLACQIHEKDILLSNEWLRIHESAIEMRACSEERSQPRVPAKAFLLRDSDGGMPSSLKFRVLPTLPSPERSPTPMTAPTASCVVETGHPSADATSDASAYPSLRARVREGA